MDGDVDEVYRRGDGQAYDSERLDPRRRDRREEDVVRAATRQAGGGEAIPEPF